MEKKQGLEVSMLCDRDTTQVAPGQAGFIQFVVMPIFQSLSHISTDIKDVQLANGTQNIEKWQVRAQAETMLREKEEKMKAVLEQAREQKKQGDDQDQEIKPKFDVDDPEFNKYDDEPLVKSEKSDNF